MSSRVGFENKNMQEHKINWTTIAALSGILLIAVTIFYGQKDIEAQKPVLSLSQVKFEESDSFILYGENQLEINIEVENKGKTLAKIDEIKDDDIEFRVKAPERGMDVTIKGGSSVEKNILASGEKTHIRLTYEPVDKGDISFFRDDQAYFYIDIKIYYTGDSGFFNKKCYTDRVFKVKNDEVIFGAADYGCVGKN